MNAKHLFLLLLISLQISCSMDTYTVEKTKSPINITGQGSDAAWQTAQELTDFIYPWRAGTPPKTSFKALYDKENLYFLYRTTDPEIITKERGLGEKDAVNSDRVELFFKADDAMNPYYSLELDALGRIVDTEGKYYRKIDFNWNWPKEGLIVKASTDKEGYWVEGSISFASLRQLGMYKDDGLLQVGLYRAEYVTQADGKIAPQWISWILPESEKPDFHIPSSFGTFRLVE